MDEGEHIVRVRDGDKIHFLRRGDIRAILATEDGGSRVFVRGCGADTGPLLELKIDSLYLAKQLGLAD